MADANQAPWSLTLSELGSRLEELRERRNLTQTAAVELLRARDVKTNVSTLSKVENGRQRRLPSALVEALLDVYGAEPEARRYVLDLLSLDTTSSGRQRRPALWRRHAALLGPMQFEGYLQLELRASRMRNYQPHLAPGLLQTQDYARHAIASMRPELGPDAIRGLVDVRMDRQQQVLGGQPLRKFQALLEQGALRRQVGGEDVRYGQLERLLCVAQEDKIEVRVLPDSVGSHPGLAGPFVLMGFADAERDVVFCELATRSVYLDGAEDVAYYDQVFTDLWSRALNPADTHSLIEEVIKEKQ